MPEDIEIIKSDEWMQAIIPLLKEGHTFRISPNGDSMFPFLLSDRDEVVLKEAFPDQLRRGDIVLFRRNSGAHILHRIWSVKPEGFYIVGDNEKKLEGPVAASQIKAVAAELIRNGKRISVRNKKYRMASNIWMRMRPFRLTVVKVRKSIYRRFHI